MKPGETVKVGEFTVRLQDNAACPSAMPLFYVFLDGEFIGKSLSLPDVDGCQWLYKQNFEGTLYSSVSVDRKPPKLRGAALTRGTRR